MRGFSKSPFWHRLPRGLHRRRVGAAGTSFEAIVIRGRPGPVAVINGGTHGDEYEGPTVLRELAKTLNPSRVRGTVVLIPVLHEAAFFAGMRCNPRDQSNLAREFPGSRRGNRAARIAHVFLGRVLRHANYYIDLHSGGAAKELLPWVGYMITGDARIDEVQSRIAACFDAWWCWGSPYIAGRTLSAAAEHGIPAIYTEARGGGGVHPDDRRALHDGLHAFLVSFGFMSGKLRRLRRQRVCLADDASEAHLQLHHCSPVRGLFVPAVTLGTTLRRGARLGVVAPLDGSREFEIRAERSGTVVGLRRRRSVSKGDALGTIVPLPAAP